MPLIICMEWSIAAALDDKICFFSPPHAYPAQQHLLLLKEAYAFPHLDNPLLYLSGKELKRFCQKVALNQSCL